MAGRGGAEAERIGAEAEPPTARADTITHQRHGRGAEDATVGTEAVRRGRDAPTPTGCTQSHQGRPQWQGAPQGRTETPTATGDTLTPSTGAQGGTRCRRWCRATLSPSRAHSLTRCAAGQGRRRRVRSIHPTHTIPTEGAQMPHRARSGARGAATRQPRQDEQQPPRMTRRGCAAYLYEYV